MELTHDDRAERNQKKDKRVQDREESDLRFVAKTVEGRRLLWRLMSEGGLFREPWSPQGTHHTDYNLGRASMARNLFYDVLNACPERFTQMQNEHAAEQKINEISEQQEIENESGLI